ncbi:unnamed protein product, partial [Urochloa humidicola]
MPRPYQLSVDSPKNAIRKDSRGDRGCISLGIFLDISAFNERLVIADVYIYHRFLFLLWLYPTM